MFETCLLAIALAMDAMAVAASRAAAGLGRREAVFLATSFGGFQAGMAALGWGFGATTRSLAARFQHWIAFALLALLGAKMLIDAFRPDRADRPPPPLDLKSIVALSIATSLDALAAGATLPLLQVPVVVALGAIGAVSWGLSLAGAYVGAALGQRFGKGPAILGGVALIAIGVRIVLTH